MKAGSKTPIVGAFFEHLGALILGGMLERSDAGDICLWDYGTTVEVKSSGHESQYGFRLDVRQIKRYEQLRDSFPFKRAWYMLFVYRNQRSTDGQGRRSSEMSQHVTIETIQPFLAKAVMHCLIVDLSVVLAWKAVLPHSSKSVLGHPGTKTVDLKYQTISPLTNGGVPEHLKRFGLDPRRFAPFRGVVKTNVSLSQLPPCRIKLPLTVVVPRREARFAQKLLRGQKGITLD